MKFSSTVVPSTEIKDHLLRIGNDGSFFENEDDDWEE